MITNVLCAVRTVNMAALGGRLSVLAGGAADSGGARNYQRGAAADVATCIFASWRTLWLPRRRATASWRGI